MWIRTAGEICCSRSCSQQDSPARIRTAVNGSKGHYDWPLHHGTAFTSFAQSRLPCFTPFNKTLRDSSSHLLGAIT